jgi:hypothetical protein
MEMAENHSCPKCGQPHLKVYYSDRSGNKVGGLVRILQYEGVLFR